jgi:hypothetical protein
MKKGANEIVFGILSWRYEKVWVYRRTSWSQIDNGNDSVVYNPIALDYGDLILFSLLMVGSVCWVASLSESHCGTRRWMGIAI